MARPASAAFVVLAAADALLAAGGRDRARWVTKPLLMPLLMAGRNGRTRRALALGWIGDVALLGAGEAAFAAGLASFLAGHLAWIAALRQAPGCGRVAARPTLVVPYLAAFGAVNAFLWPRVGRYRVPVLAYGTVLVAMSLTALDHESPAAAAGGALFVVSDSLLALEKFGGVRLPAHGGLMMASYASAQALLATTSHEPGTQRGNT